MSWTPLPDEHHENNVLGEGPWEAEIETGSDWIRINGVLGGRAKGATGSEIRFSYQPDGTIGADQ